MRSPCRASLARDRRVVKQRVADGPRRGDAPDRQGRPERHRQRGRSEQRYQQRRRDQREHGVVARHATGPGRGHCTRHDERLVIKYYYSVRYLRCCAGRGPADTPPTATAAVSNLAVPDFVTNAQGEDPPWEPLTWGEYTAVGGRATVGGVKPDNGNGDIHVRNEGGDLTGIPGFNEPGYPFVGEADDHEQSETRLSRVANDLREEDEIHFVGAYHYDDQVWGVYPGPWHLTHFSAVFAFSE